MNGLEFRRMLPSDVYGLDLGDHQDLFRPLLERPAYAEDLARCPVAQACVLEGRILGLAGVAREPDAPHLGRGWALVGRDVPRDAWDAITAEVRRVLRAALDDFPAISAEVNALHRPSHAWAYWLGFRLTGFRLCRYSGSPFPALVYTLTDPPGYGLPVSVSAALEFVQRTHAAWLRHPPNTDPNVILSAASRVRPCAGNLAPPANGERRSPVARPQGEAP